MNTLLTRGLLAFLLFITTFQLPAAETSEIPLIFGFLPSQSPVSLFAHYTPLVEYLSHKIGRKIQIETAPDYPTFLNRTRNRHYDFVLTAPHFALLALDSGKYLSPVTYTKGLMADILVTKNSLITSPRQLAGKIIALPPESAIISMAGKYYIQQQGLKGTHAPRFKITHSHNDSVHTLLSGEADAAIVSYNITRQFKKKNIKLKKIASTDKLPGMAFLVARNLSTHLRKSFSHSLVEMNKQKEGQQALTRMGYPGYRKTRKNEFEVTRPYIRMYMETLQKGTRSQ